MWAAAFDKIKTETLQTLFVVIIQFAKLQAQISLVFTQYNNLQLVNYFLDVDECKEGVVPNGGCAQKCVDDKPGYHCECEEGELATDEKNCTSELLCGSYYFIFGTRS